MRTFGRGRYKNHFWIRHVNDFGVLEAMLAVVEICAIRGWRRTRFRRAAGSLAESLGSRVLPVWEVDGLFELYTRAATSEWRYRAITQPGVRRLTPYVGFASLGHRARHNRMSDKIFALEHPVWGDWWTPCGFCCSCYNFTINKYKAKRMELEGPEPTGPPPDVKPSPGWEGPPAWRECSRPQIDLLGPGLRAVIERVVSSVPDEN